MKTPKRFPCPRCRGKGFRSVFAIQMTDPDSPEAYDGYELKFRIVCKRCGFAGYSVPLAKEALLNKGWNEAVFDYCGDWYVLPTAQPGWLTVKRPYRRHPTKRAKPKTPRASAARDSGQHPLDPSQLTINDLPGAGISDVDAPDTVQTYDCYKDSDNVSYNDRDAEVLRKLIERSTYGMHTKT